MPYEHVGKKRYRKSFRLPVQGSWSSPYVTHGCGCGLRLAVIVDEAVGVSYEAGFYRCGGARMSLVTVQQ